MSDCHGDGISQVPGLVSNWVKEYVSGWAEQARSEGYTAFAPLRNYVDTVESRTNAGGFSVGKQLVDAIRVNDPAKINNAVDKLMSLPEDSRLDAACLALHINNEDRAIVPSLPRVEIVTQRRNDGDPQLQSLKIGSLIKISTTDFR